MSPSHCTSRFFFSSLLAPMRLLLAVALVGFAMGLSGCECGITDGDSPPIGDDGFVDDDDSPDNDDDDTTDDGPSGPEDCSNGLDDDGDGDADCSDSDCAGDAACAHECVPAETIACGEVKTSNNAGPGHTQAIDTYGCTTWDESGPEYTFRYSAASSAEVTAVLTVAGNGNLDVFVLEDEGACDGDACIAYGASTVHWSASAGQDYLVVVDGYAGGQDNFSLELLCPGGGTGGEICFNGTDDDGDGAVDCADSDCATDPACLSEDCNNNIDDDGDGYVDCDDTECWGELACDLEDCSNNVDDNGDGYVDCDDLDCIGEPGCTGEVCYDGVDNDGDSYVDCDDFDCMFDSPDCLPEGDCDDGLDGDGDGLTDCDDDECFLDSDCQGEICNNETDDDFDGQVDCLDNDCFSNHNCISELCENGLDVDGDGDIDCDDLECAAVNTCAPVCTPITALSCDASVAGDTASTPGFVDVISTYGCTGANESGNEIAYSFTAASSGEVTFVLDGLAADLDLFGLQDTGAGCEANSCLDSSTSGGTTAESVTMTVNIGQTYFAVVDGWNENSGPYTLDVTCAEGLPEICDNGTDDDGDSLVDCLDVDCAGTVGCATENCSDGIDNDGDGRVDCADPVCSGPPVADPACTPELCDNGVDDDGDGRIDCVDPECAFDPSCGSENCTNGVDDDGDFRIDCLDPNCFWDPACGGAGDDDDDDDDDGGIPGIGGIFTENCINNIDDDGDGRVDCDDLSCLINPLCWFLNEDCSDGSDNDLDGAVDCADVDCSSDSNCIPELCTNNTDDDGDGDTDCADEECFTAPFCVGEECGNGMDDDSDGLTDCEDPECSVHPTCVAEICSDNADNDADGLVDCDDPECAGQPVCAAANEDCFNDIDDNGDGLIDCADPTCASNQNCIAEICFNGTDDDGDLLADCDDPECEEDPNCGDELCWNGLDDDGDGDIDCDDDQCAGWEDCDSEICDNGVDDDGDLDVDCDDVGCLHFGPCIGEDCGNDRDDDGDGLVDCGDPDCAAECTSGAEHCSNGVDDDGDGDVDCADDNCAGLPACSEDCTNDVDDDGDGDVDCDDSDCTGVVGCITEVCDNATDDDGDGQVDCADAECATDAACIAEICSNDIDDDGDLDVDCDDSECLGTDPACGEVCDNGVDDDGDGDIDEDDSDCVTDSGDVGVGGVCIQQMELGCGDTDTWFNWGSGSADIIDMYDCTSWDASGREYAYVFRPENDEDVTVNLSNMSGGDLDIYVLSDFGGCDGLNCFTNANDTVTFFGIAGETYYLLVDGFEGATSDYDIAVSCPSTNEICDNGVDDDADGLVDCDDESCQGLLECDAICQEAWVIWCGSTTVGSTYSSFATNQVDSYSCNSWQESGPEFAYYFQAPLDQANDVEVILSVDEPTMDLDVFVMGDQGIPCDSQSCIAAGSVTAQFQTEPGGDYWVAIDGYQGDAGGYTVSVDCTPVGDQEDCDDGEDNDADGDVDCDDDDCEGTELCASYCSSIASISCGEVVTGDTSDASGPATDTIDGYPCNVGNYSGPEVAYQWLATQSGTISWELIDPSPTDVNHDPFVLDGDNGECINTQCIADGFSSVEWEAVAGHTYYLVLDGVVGDEGPYAATLNCSLDL